jgi:hypothetical protein
LRHRAARDHAKKTAFLAWLLLLLAVVAALLPSCGTRNKAGEVAGGFVQTGAGMTVELRVDPFPPKAMQKATFTIAVTGVDGLPVSGATVFCNMTMPEMDMPLNRPEVTEMRPGTYSADALFTMAGKWQAALEIILADGRTGTFAFAMSTR